MSGITNNYITQVLDEPFTSVDGVKFEQTIVVRFFREGKEVKGIRYGRVSKKDLYDRIHKGDPINLNNCYVKDFSLEEYRDLKGLEERSYVEFAAFSATNSFFDSTKETDFSYARFPITTMSFEGAVFNYGKTSFYKAHFEEGDVVFKDADFGLGDVNFQYAEFGDGNIIFQDARFNCDSISFVNVSFGKGRVNFRGVDFGDSDVNFHFAKFEDGDISFERTSFGGDIIDFRKIEFGSGRINFRRANFGNGDVLFKESEFGEGKLTFILARFGGDTSFEMVDFGKGEVVFEKVNFGIGRVSFNNSKFETLIFRGSFMDNYLDLRVADGGLIDLSDTIIRNIIDFKPFSHPVKIKELNINGMRNLGRIFIDWKKNNVLELIAGQENTTISEKAFQFNILKEDFNSNGEYNNEDKAYVTFKRYELRAEKEEAIAKSSMNGFWVYPYYYLNKILFDMTGQYATNPVRVLTSMSVVYVLFSILFVLIIQPDFIDADIVSSVGDPDKLSVIEKSFYHSAITFLTIGYGDFYPSGHIRWLSNVEGWVGLFFMSYFTVAFVRKILR